MEKESGVGEVVGAASGNGSSVESQSFHVTRITNQ
jgi:hypothetical protein